jgi:hypothetical protein
MASDSDASDVEMENAPPLLGWSDWMGDTRRTLAAVNKLLANSPRPSNKCRLDRTTTTTKAAAARPSTGGRQTTLLAHARPARWTAASMALSADAIETIVLHLMAQSDARTLRALAVVNRECAKIVRDTLRRACHKLQNCAWSFSEAQQARRYLDLYEEDATAIDAVDEERLEARHAYQRCMLETGIPEPRMEALVRKPRGRWFHGSTSLLGHLQQGCELCSSEEARDTGFRAGPVALFACRKCAHKNCVRFLVHKSTRDRAFHHPKGCAQRLTVCFPRHESEANNYACALMSKRESHRRRMAGSHLPKARRTVPLSRRVHTNQQPWTIELQDSWQLWSDECYGPTNDIDEMPFELWHELPSCIPSGLTFARVMGLGNASEETRVQANNHSAVRRRSRAAIDARRAAFNRVAHTHRVLIDRVNRLVRERGFRAWLQVIELCCAARSFELRWLFRADESRFGDWRKARYKLLDMHPIALVEAAHRISSATHVLQRVFSQICYSDGSKPDQSPSRAEPTRACVLEILKHLPMTCLSPGLEDSLYEKVQHLRQAELALTLVVDESRPAGDNQRLLVKVKVDPRVIGRPNLELYAIITPYTITRLHSLLDMPECERFSLSIEAALRIQQIANNWFRVEARDRVRAVLFALPGAWPYACTWERNS